MLTWSCDVVVGQAFTRQARSGECKFQNIRSQDDSVVAARYSHGRQAIDLQEETLSQCLRELSQAIFLVYFQHLLNILTLLATFRTINRNLSGISPCLRNA